MIKYCNKIILYCKDCTYDKFIANTMLIEACVFNIGQLGELCRNADDDFMSAHSEIPWKVIRGMRNRIVHDYEGVNIQLVWETIEKNIPTLLCSLNNIQQELKAQEDQTPVIPIFEDNDIKNMQKINNELDKDFENEEDFER